MRQLIIAAVGLALIATFLTLAPTETQMLRKEESTRNGIPAHIVERFQQWKIAFNKRYGTLEEEEAKLAIFFANLLHIERENAAQSDYVLGETVFMDITTEEFTSQYLGLIAEPSEYTEEDFTPSNITPFNWATKGAVTPVKDQGQCGSCWAFSTTGNVEGWWFLTKGTLPNLSEQQLVDCAGVAYGNFGCNGGNPISALGYVIKKGITTESAYPYKGKDQSCKIQGGAYKTNGKQASSTCSALLTNIQSQPTSVAVDATNWSFYKKGVFNNCKANLNHAVLATGYDQNQNWIIKNSWGTSWGEKGYITLQTGNTCGVCQQQANSK